MPDPTVRTQNLCKSEPYLLRGADEILENPWGEKWPYTLVHLLGPAHILDFAFNEALS
jgi:hypothetical protein